MSGPESGGSVLIFDNVDLCTTKVWKTTRGSYHQKQIQQNNKTGTGSSIEINGRRTHFMSVGSQQMQANEPTWLNHEKHQLHILNTKKLLMRQHINESNIVY